jgi:hypothetical protein
VDFISPGCSTSQILEMMKHFEPASVSTRQQIIETQLKKIQDGSKISKKEHEVATGWNCYCLALNVDHHLQTNRSCNSRPLGEANSDTAATD